SVYLRRQVEGVDTGARKKRSGVFSLVHAGWLDRWILEAHLAQQSQKLTLLESAGDTTHPQLHIVPQLRRHVSPDHYVRDREPAAWLQHPKGFAQHLSLVARQIDYAVGDDHIHRRVGKRNVLDLPLEELNVLGSSSRFVLVGQRQHLVSHVETVNLPLGPDSLGGQQNIDTAARS